MKKILLLVLAVVIVGATPAYGWSRIGHATIAKIAEDYLTPKAKKQIDKYLNGKSIIYYATYPDDYREVHLIDIGFDATNCPRKTVWGHTFQANADGSLYLSERRGNEYVKNCLLRIDPVIKEFKKNHRNMTDSARVVSLAYIVHIVGDIHCPKHIRYEDEPTAGGYNVIYRGNAVKYHSYWDGAVVLKGRHDWGYSDIANLVDVASKKERKELSKGNIFDWAAENARNSRFTVERREGCEVSYLTANEDTKYAEQQVAKAGYRLAALLNDIFK